MRLQTIAIIGLTLVGFALRLRYLSSSHPFFDEYTTVLAARQILRVGWPLLPSGLFYEHGLLATYLVAPFVALFVNVPTTEWQPAHWGLMLARWPSLLISTVTMPLIYRVGRRGFGRAAYIPLLAAGLMAISPEGIVWGGRARMYALATLLVLVTIYLAYRGALYPAPAKYRWLALATLLATLLTQFGALMLVPALVVSVLVVGWLSHQARSTGSRPWFLQQAIVLEGATLVVIVGLAVLVKRLGRPLGTAALGDPSGSGLLAELLNTITYQTTFYFTWADTIQFLSRQFGVSHHIWLALLTIVGTVIGLAGWITAGRVSNFRPKAHFLIFIWLNFGLLLLEMVTLLEPFRRNPRYIVMYLPLFYLIAANAIFNLRLIPRLLPKRFLTDTQAARRWHNLFRHLSIETRSRSYIILALLLLVLLAGLGFADLRIALTTPEPAYEQAFARIKADWQPGDKLVTMNTAAAGLYLDQVDGFTVQNQADQFLLNAGTEPVDRWLGSPWLGTVADFKAVLDNNERTWFVIDTVRQPVYFKADWQVVVSTQMEQVWSHDNVLVYRTREDRETLPSAPDTLVGAVLGNSIQLLGYSLRPPDSQSLATDLQVTLFWQPRTQLPLDYTTFVHLRSSDGTTIAQRDSQPLEGRYPTSRWQPNEIVIDPVRLLIPAGLPAGSYTIFAGLYRLDTLERLSVADDTSGENAIRLGEVTLE
jgi:uncharacterized membrane protein